MLSTIPFKRRILIADILILLIGFTGIYQVAEKPGLPVLLANDQNKITVSEILPGNKTPLKPGDVIKSVNGKNVSAVEDVEFLFDGMSAGQIVDLEIVRYGNVLHTNLKLARINSIFYLIILTFVGMVFWAVGTYVYQNRKQKEKDVLIFHWISITVSIHIMTTFGCYSIDSFHLGYLLRIIFFVASSLTPVLFIEFSFLFPTRRTLKPAWILKALYPLAAVFSIVLSVIFVISAHKQSPEWFHYFMRLYNLGRWFFALCMIFGVSNFIRSYINAVEESERRKLRWVILGIAISPLSFVFLWQIPQTLTSAALVSEEFVLLTSVFAPLAFAISIIRYHILDIDFIFNRSSVYFIVLTLIMIIYSGIVALTALIVGSITVRGSLIISAIAAVVIALLFEPARRVVQKFVNRKFFRVRYNYRIAQREFTNELGHFVRLKPMSEYIADKLYQLIQPESIGIIVAGQYLNDWSILAHIHFDELTFGLKSELKAFSDRSLKSPLAADRFVEQGIDYEPAEKQVFKANRIVLAFPLRMQNSGTAGYLVLGKKKSRTQYSFEDIDLLKTITAQLSQTIEHIRLHEDLLIKQAETQRLDELNKMKTFFVSSVSHDLQTPLTSIRMFAELLQTKKHISAEEKQEYLETIQGETERLSRLINNVLDFSRIERGTKKYVFSKVNLIEVIQSAIRIMNYQIKENGFEFETDISSDEIEIWADADTIIEAITNLISNAIKYSSDEKYICISLETNADYAIIRIRDKGIGIEASEKEKIFETFYRSSDQRIQAAGGAGLGLSLVRHVVEAHRGEVTVESEPGKGSTFSLSLPIGKIQ